MQNLSENLIEKIKYQLQSGLYTPVDLFLGYTYTLTLEQFEAIVKEHYPELVEVMMQLQEIVYLYRQKLRVLAEVDQKYPFRINLQHETELVWKDIERLIENAGLIQKLYQGDGSDEPCRISVSHLLEHFAELKTAEADSLVVNYELYLQRKYKL